ncbi:MAG: polysaccharide biosynthesis/export family protein [Candidatus Omnitrophica bacterium]|nr:polysaccharide biosynthesis/export family protein [Candidatus Omnitrophota bacterium]
MKNFLILSVFTVLIISLPPASFAQNRGIISGNTDQVGASKQSGQRVVSVINAPNEDLAITKEQLLASGAIAAPTEYTIGIGDVLDIHVLKPETMYNSVTVAPDGTIVFPYIGSVKVRYRTVAQIQDEIQLRLANGYMKYPVVSVSLEESNSRRFFVYGQVVKPGAYNMEENMTVLRAISMAGGFSQFGSASRVKILRPKKGASGYDVIKVSIKDVMDGIADADPDIAQGDIIVVSEGIF